jgi:HTH-type transcriptional repressor of NAD biosynthesis genes
MFHEVYLGEPYPYLLRLAHETPADLYILTDYVGVPFEDDGTRFNSGRRSWMTDWFEKHLPGPVVKVGGSPEIRVSMAVNAITPIMTWDIADPIEYAQAAA